MTDENESIELNINVPDRILIQDSGVLRIIAEAPKGFFGILPHRLDCITSLVPGILIYESKGKGECFVAIDEGILIKFGLKVVVSVRSAIPWDNLSEMKMRVEQAFKQRSEQEQYIRVALTKIEDDFIRLYHEVHHG